MRHAVFGRGEVVIMPKFEVDRKRFRFRDMREVTETDTFEEFVENALSKLFAEGEFLSAPKKKTARLDLLAKSMAFLVNTLAEKGVIDPQQYIQEVLEIYDAKVVENS